MGERHAEGILDTCVYIDLAEISPGLLPAKPKLTVVSMTELQQGVAMAKEPAERARRTERLGDAVTAFNPLPFDGPAASRFGTMVALTLAAGRDPRPRRLDLMIASIASVRGLPLYTRNADDFKGLESAVTVVAI
ncbi:type II toxin-antitoxin system VapC family toxin [Streptomyces sp. KLOTTS4A1]|uniref:type II toxin-antitoxin system VapC family toxin n=1 Tax=Streptomyces sp. KLOTTS4A1 TaxID=3390996 RepID=UPI0039F64832